MVGYLAGAPSIQIRSAKLGLPEKAPAAGASSPRLKAAVQSLRAVLVRTVVLILSLQTPGTTQGQ